MQRAAARLLLVELDVPGERSDESAQLGHVLGEGDVQVRQHGFQLVQIEVCEFDRRGQDDAVAASDLFDAVRGVHQPTGVQLEQTAVEAGALGGRLRAVGGARPNLRLSEGDRRGHA